MSTGSTTHQTQSFLLRRFKEAGYEPNTRYGQNFLIDLNLQRVLLDAAELGPADVVLEVGTGTGSLTRKMAPLVAHVVTVEVDRRLAQLASEELIDCENVTLLVQDALRNKNRLQQGVLDAVSAAMSAEPGRVFKLVANLPYNVATPVISNLLVGPQIPRTMVVTIQKELAERIAARPSTKDYSALSIWVQSQCRVELVRTMPPAAFWPRPKVHSAIIRIDFDERLRERIGDVEFFHQFVRAMFFHRRKLLRSVAVSAMKGQLNKESVDAVLAEVGLSPEARAEQLDVETMIRLSKAMHGRIQEAG